MKELNEARAQRAEVVDKIAAFSDIVTVENRGFTPEEDTNLRALEAEKTKLDGQISQLEIVARAQAEKAGRSGITIGIDANNGPSENDKRDISKFSFLRAIQSQLPNSGVKLEGIELEMHQEAAQDYSRRGASLTGVGIPEVVMKARTMEKRDNSITMPTQPQDGSALVQTQKFISFDDLMRNALVLTKLGATYRDDLAGAVEFVRKSSRPVATWKPEVGNLDKSNITYTGVSMAPKRLGTYTVHSKQFLMQTAASVEADVRTELAYSIAEGIEYAALFGTGTNNEPKGLKSYTTGEGKGLIELGAANAGAALTRANLITAISTLLSKNVNGRNYGWVYNALTAGKLMDTVIAAGSDRFLQESLDTLLNFPVGLTNSIPSNVQKGTGPSDTTYAFFGAWENLYIGRYGAYDLTVDNITLARAGQVQLIIQAFADVLVYEPKAFVQIDYIKN